MPDTKTERLLAAWAKLLEQRAPLALLRVQARLAADSASEEGHDGEKLYRELEAAALKKLQTYHSDTPENQ